MADGDNPFLVGNFAPIDDEQSLSTLEVTGQLPTSLRGSLCRIGPNPIDPNPNAYHWFMGDGMVHSVRLADGRASYQNRWVRTDRICDQLAETPIPDQPRDVSPGSNRANTNIIRHAGRIFALEEASLPVELGSDLQTIGRFNYDGKLKTNWSAHPKIDPETGELHSFAYGFVPPLLTYYRVNSEGELVESREVEIPRAVMIHDFAITETYAVFFDLPVVFDLERAMARQFPFSWQPQHGARVGLMPLSSGQVTWHDVEPCYVYHPLNAYNDGDRVVVDVVRHPSMFAAETNHGPDSAGPSVLARWTVSPTVARVAEETVCAMGAEFPRIDDRRLGRRHRYGYRCSGQAVFKHDLFRGATGSFDFGPGSGPREAVFVPDSPSAAEDEGWLLSLVYRPDLDTSELVVLDADRISGGPVASVRMPRRVPFGFHSNWFADSK